MNEESLALVQFAICVLKILILISILIMHQTKYILHLVDRSHYQTKYDPPSY